MTQGTAFADPNLSRVFERLTRKVTDLERDVAEQRQGNSSRRETDLLAGIQRCLEGRDEKITVTELRCAAADLADNQREFDKWISEIRCAQKQFQWSDKTLKTTIWRSVKNNPKQLLTNACKGKEEITSGEEMLRILTNRYGMSNMSARFVLDSCVQENNENCREYGSRLKELASKCGERNSYYLTTLFTAGLRCKDIAIFVNYDMGPSYDSDGEEICPARDYFKDAIAKARNIEKCREEGIQMGIEQASIHGGPRLAAWVNSPSNRKRQQNQQRQGNDQQNNQQQNRPFDKQFNQNFEQRNVNQGRMNNPGYAGNQNQDNRVETRTCNTCGVQGHLSRNCGNGQNASYMPNEVHPSQAPRGSDGYGNSPGFRGGNNQGYNQGNWNRGANNNGRNGNSNNPGWNNNNNNGSNYGRNYPRNDNRGNDARRNDSPPQNINASTNNANEPNGNQTGNNSSASRTQQQSNPERGQGFRGATAQ